MNGFRTSLVLLTICLFSKILISQTFQKEYDLFSGKNDVGLTILEHDNRIYSINNEHDLTSNGFSIVEISNDGEIIWKKEFDDIYVNPESSVISNDKIVIGGTFSSLDSVGIYSYDLSGVFVDKFVITKPIEFDRMILWNLIEFNSKVVVSGWFANSSNSFEAPFIYVISDNDLITPLDIGFEENLIYYNTEMRLGEFNDLHVFSKYGFIDDLNNDTIERYDVSIFDENLVLNSTSVYPRERNDSSQNPNYSLSMTGFGIFISDGVQSPSARLVKIDVDGNFSEFFEFDFQDSMQYMVYDIGVGGEDEVYCTGYLWDRRENSQTNSFVAKIDKFGTLNWIRHFDYGYDFDIERHINSFLFSLEILDNGDVVCTGSLHRKFASNFDVGFINNLTILRLDSDGCILDDCNEWISVSAHDIEKLKTARVVLYPNLVQNQFYFELTSDYSIEFKLMLLDLQGTVLYEDLRISNVASLEDISFLNSGIYVVHIIMESGKSISKRIVKL